MNDKALPVRYYLEIYERSFVNDPTASFDGTSPFGAFHVGDLFDPHSLLRDVDVPENHLWKITDVVHRVWQIDKSHIGHQIGLCVSAVPRPK